MSDSQTRFAQGAIAGAAVSAFFISPLVPYTDLRWLAILGTWFGVALGIFWAEQDGSKTWKYISAGLMMLALIGLTTVFTGANTEYERKRKHCSAIELEMLSGKSKRTDLPEVFDALDCPTQGKVPIDFLND